jgi:hypothetical protein
MSHIDEGRPETFMEYLKLDLKLLSQLFIESPQGLIEE